MTAKTEEHQTSEGKPQVLRAETRGSLGQEHVDLKSHSLIQAVTPSISSNPLGCGRLARQGRRGAKRSKRSSAREEKARWAIVGAGLH